MSDLEAPLPRDHLGRTIDFGRTAEDYERFRPGFPAALFDRLLALGWIRPEDRALDVGSGTGAMALGLAGRGLAVTALDRSAELLQVLSRRAASAGLRVRVLRALAEETGEPVATYELYSAGQCWWWLDPARAIAEARRVLVPGGRILIASFCYLPLPGSVAERTEALILRHNPGWTAGGSTGVFPEQVTHLASARCAEVESFSFDVPVSFTHEGWRGRIRACNGVAASLAPEEVRRFDEELAELLARDHPGELLVTHRVFVATARVGTEPGAVPA